MGMYSTMRDREAALKDAFRNWPQWPSGLALHILGRNGGDHAKDWRRGKELQFERGLNIIVPMECEAEIGAGYWDRITNGAWRHFVPGHIESLDERSEQTQT